MRMPILITLILLLTSCTGIRKGNPPISRNMQKLKRLTPDLKRCAKNVNLEDIGEKLTRKTGRKFKKPLFTYAAKIKGVYYLRYFFPLVNQIKFAGAEVWVNCKNPHKIYYKFLPLE